MLPVCFEVVAALAAAAAAANNMRSQLAGKYKVKFLVYSEKQFSCDRA
jgi:hypothetical protein